MPLDNDKIKQLYLKSKSPKIKPTDIGLKVKKPIRLNRQYPRLPEDGLVRQVADTKRCASRGCSAPTHFTHKGIPYCTIHLIYLLNIENTELRRYGNGAQRENIAGNDRRDSTGTGTTTEYTISIGDTTSQDTL
jgi:hypothetical protein